MRKSKILVIAALFVVLAFILCGCLQVKVNVKPSPSVPSPSVTIEDLVEANSPVTVCSRHKNWINKITVADDTLAQYYGLYGYTCYNERGTIYSDRDWYDSETGGHYRDDFYATDDDVMYMSYDGNGEKTLLAEWFPMTKEEEVEKRIALHSWPDDYGSVALSEEGTEKIVSTKDNGDGTITLISNCPVSSSGDVAYMPEEWENATVEYVYTANKDNLELYKLDTSIITANGKIHYLTQETIYDQGWPEDYKAFRDALDTIEATKDRQVRTVTVIYDPGTDKEEKFEKTESITIMLYTRYRDEYGLYNDPEGKEPYTGSDGKEDETVYAIP